MYPPYDNPEMPNRPGSAMPSAMQWSTPAMMSRKSMPPPSPITACANACPRPMLPRGLGSRHAYPESARSTAFGSESEKNEPQFHVGPPCTQTISGSGPSAPRGVISTPSISSPSGAFQRIVRTSGNSVSATTASLNDVTRDQPPDAWSNLASSGGWPCA